MAEIIKIDDREWLTEALPKHDRLAAAVTLLLENMLKKKTLKRVCETEYSYKPGHADTDRYSSEKCA